MAGSEMVGVAGAARKKKTLAVLVGESDYTPCRAELIGERCDRGMPWDAG